MSVFLRHRWHLHAGYIFLRETKWYEKFFSLFITVPSLHCPYKMMSPTYHVHLYCVHRNHRPQFRWERWDLADFSGHKTSFLSFHPQPKSHFIQKKAFLTSLGLLPLSTPWLQAESNLKIPRHLRALRFFKMLVFGKPICCTLSHTHRVYIQASLIFHFPQAFLIKSAVKLIFNWT